MNTSRSSRPIVTLFAIILAGAVIWLIMADNGERVRLPDGREVSIAAVTYGTNHMFAEGTLWGRLARPFVSPGRARALGLQVYRQTTPEPSLFVWTRWDWEQTNRVPRFASVCDENGLETEPESALVFTSFEGTNGALVAWKFDNFPRSEAGFDLRFYERDSSYRPSRVGKIHVTSPAPDRRGARSAPLAPAIQKRGELEIKLVSLRTGERPPASLTNRYQFIARPTMAWFEVRDRGVLSSNWTIRGVQVSAESGNRFLPPMSVVVEESGGRLGVAFSEVFWPGEPEWRIRVEFARTRAFGTNNSWTLSGLPAALGNAPFTTNVNLVAREATLQTIRISQYSPFPYRRGPYRRNTNVSLVYKSWIPGMRVDLASAIDNNGTPLRFGHAPDLMEGRSLSGLELLTNTTSVDLTFVAHSTETVEFRVRPEFVPDSGSAN